MALCAILISMAQRAICGAKNRVTVVQELFPLFETTIWVLNLIRSIPTELVRLAQELVCSKDGEDTEDEYNEEKDTHEARNRAQYRINLPLDLRKLVN